MPLLGAFCGRFQEELKDSSDSDQDEQEAHERDPKIRGPKSRSRTWNSFFGTARKKDSAGAASVGLILSQNVSQITVQRWGKKQKASSSVKVARLQLLQRPDLPSSLYNSISKMTGIHTIEIIKCERDDVPPGLPDMEGLAVLKMSRNRLTRFSEDLSKVKNIAHIILDNNRISDFPQGLFGRSFQHLEVINLADNMLTILPSDFGVTGSGGSQSNSNIRHIDMSNNRLVALPETIAKYCNNLEVLILTHNRLKTLGKSFRLSKLQRLFVAFNELVDLPDDIGYCRQLTKLRLSRNCIREFPESILNLWKDRGGRLEELLVDLNPLVMPSITTFEMAGNSESSIGQAFEHFAQCIAERNLIKKQIETISKKQMDEEEKQRQLQRALDRAESVGKAGDGQTTNGNRNGGGTAVLALVDRHDGDTQPGLTESPVSVGGKVGLLPDYYSAHCNNDPAMIAEIRNTESTLIFIKKNMFVEKQQQAAILAQNSGMVPEHLREFLVEGFNPGEWNGKVSVTDLDLYFNLMVMSTKPMFSTCATLFDKFENDNKGYLNRTEWSECCVSIAISLSGRITENMWELMAWRSPNKVYLCDFVAAWHIHDIETRDPWIARISDVLKMDYYDMDVSELRRRLRAKDSQDASPDIDFDVAPAIYGDKGIVGTDGEDAAAYSLMNPVGLRQIWYSPALRTDVTVDSSRETERNRLKEELGPHVSLTNDQQLDADALARLENYTMEDEDTQTLNSEKLSDDSGSDESEFDAQVFLQQHKELTLRSKTEHKNAAFVVDNDEKIEALMEMSYEEFERVRLTSADPTEHPVQLPSPVTKIRKRTPGAKKESAHPSMKSKTDVFAVRQAMRSAYRSMPLNDFIKLNGFMLRALHQMKHSSRDSFSYCHDDDPTFRHSMGMRSRNRYTIDLLHKMGFMPLTVSNCTYWVWPSIHLNQDGGDRGKSSSGGAQQSWGERQVPATCQGKDRNRLEDMISLVVSCQRAIREKGPGFNGHFRQT
eukprot:TRINITY_DN67392_c0_g1_i1.p1 TRINITY_DN67392_c0_g1~~TRINITY_DN67392_c0_g1_i1.p1  ORF type:complete len:999 (+),score=156.69 TRINITY_DN67392_c0_g1_i1:175-3171(+)